MTLLFGMPIEKVRAFRRELGPSFVNVQQEAFYDSQAPEVLYSGAFRAGKSRIGCEKAYWLAKRYPGIPIGIFRKVARDLDQSTELTLTRDVIPRSAIARSNKTQRWYELANGSRISFFGLETDPISHQPAGVGSVELGWAFIDEAAQCSEDDWKFVKGRLSWPGIPYHQLAGATNPASPAHWLKTRFTPPSPTRVYLHARTLDNPMLPADYVAEQVAMPDGWYRQRYVEGEWVATEGQIWLLPDNQVRDLPSQKWHQVIAGIDWGYQHAFACEVGVQSGLGRKAIVDELYARGRTVPSLIPELVALRDKWGIEVFYADPSEPAYIAECRQAGLVIVEATNDVLPGITAVSDEIANGLWVSPNCTGLLNEIPGYVWATERASGQPKDVPVKMGDDACDALRYLAMAWRRQAPAQFSLVA